MFVDSLIKLNKIKWIWIDLHYVLVDGINWGWKKGYRLWYVNVNNLINEHTMKELNEKVIKCT